MAKASNSLTVMLGPASFLISVGVMVWFKENELDRKLKFRVSVIEWVTLGNYLNSLKVIIPFFTVSMQIPMFYSLFED